MAGRGMALTRPAWMKHAEEAKVKDEEEKAATARAAFDATFRDVEGQGGAPGGGGEMDSDSDGEEVDQLEKKPIGPVDPGKCTAAGTGVGGGAAGAAASFVVVMKDSDGRRIPHGGAYIRVRVTPGAGVGGVEQDAVVKDHADGTYTATYAVAKRGDYMVSVECNGHPISGSPFPVFFSGGNVPLGVSMMPTSAPMLGASPYMGVSQQIGPFSMQGMLPAGSTMGGLSQMPMAPSAAAMAAAQSIAAANAFQAAQAAQQQQQQQAGQDHGDGKEEDDEDNHEPICTLHVTNINPILTADQLRQLFNYCGTVVDCAMSESKTTAYVEYSRPEGAKAGLSLNDMPVGGQNLKVELKRKPRSGKHGTGSTLNGMGPPQLPMMMQQAVVMQQMQFQQALYMQQALATQQAAARAATVKSAAEMASARAAEISKRLAGPNDGVEVAGVPETVQTSPSARSKTKSRSNSRSPIRYHRDRRSRSATPARLRRGRSRSRYRDRNLYRSRERGSRYRGGRDSYSSYYTRRDWERERDNRDPYSLRSGRRARSRSRSRDRVRRRSRTRSGSQSRSLRGKTPSPRRYRTYESHHRSTTRSSRRTRSRSKETRKSRSKTPRSGSATPARRKGSPKGGKLVSSPGTSKDHIMSPKGRERLDSVDGVRKELDKTDHVKIDQPKRDSSAKDVVVGNGRVANKGTAVDEVLMEIKSSLNTKLDTATILKDLEDKRRQQLSSFDGSKNAVSGSAPSPEAAVGSDVKDFKKPLKKCCKESTSTGDDVSEEEETELIDDWRDDFKSQGREKNKNKVKKERVTVKKSKVEEEREVQNGKGCDSIRDAKIVKKVAEFQGKEVKGTRQAQNGVESNDHGRWGTRDMDSDFDIADMQVEGPPKRVLSPPERVKDPVSNLVDVARVVENFTVSTAQIIDEKMKGKMIGPDMITEKLVCTDVREEIFVQKSRDENSFLVENVKQINDPRKVDVRLKESKTIDEENEVNTVTMERIRQDRSCEN
ncbi:uncharacterized protein [Physcomitrium patens]|uniref:uncharacterized protein isoform X1 n=1 Tax=Physcomitrium patens TaxID=3218 RepID=UPI003CCDFA46